MIIIIVIISTSFLVILVWAEKLAHVVFIKKRSQAWGTKAVEIVTGMWGCVQAWGLFISIHTLYMCRYGEIVEVEGFHDLRLDSHSLSI